MRFAYLLCALGLVTHAGAAVGQSATPPAPGRAAPAADPLSTVLQLDAVAIGFASTPGGRMFVPLSRIDGSVGPQLIEWVEGNPVPYPDPGWNGWRAGDDASAKFVRANTVRVGPRGAHLWVVDAGSPTIGAARVEHGPKVVQIDLATNKITRVFPLDDVTSARSVVDDLRFHNQLAYITDSGSPGIIVLDLQSGTARRVLDGDPSMTAQRAVTADDHVLRGPDGKPVKIHADQLEVSPDGKFIFYQPASGPLSRIATRYIDDPKLTTTELTKHITTFAKTGSTGGSAIDADGTIYCSDIDKRRIVAIDTDGHQRTLLQDARLLWVDAMWIDGQGNLFMPAAQLDRMAPFNNGVSKLQLPVTIYKMKIDGKPPPSDHP